MHTACLPDIAVTQKDLFSALTQNIRQTPIHAHKRKISQKQAKTTTKEKSMSLGAILKLTYIRKLQNSKYNFPLNTNNKKTATVNKGKTCFFKKIKKKTQL